MNFDANKLILNIDYNYLNLPQTIEFKGNRRIQFVYSADGEKLQKIVTDGGTVTTTDYINGVEYRNGITQRIAHAEGEIARTATGSYQREYVLRDHLGNTRVTFCDLNNDGLTNVNEVLQSNSYYPFGLNMEMNTNGANGTNKYQYNGKELNQDLGLNWNDYGARFYDAAMGRWGGVDALATHPKQVGYSPYSAFANNPIRYVDPTGMIWENPKDAERLNKSVNNRIEGINKDNAKIQAQIDKGGLSEKKLSKLRCTPMVGQ